MVVALISIPLFLRELGEERYGALMLIWMLVGYFGILDLGMGRAMTKMTAEYMGLNRQSLLPNIFWTALMMMVCLGLCGAFLLVGSSHWLVSSLLKIPLALQDETRRAFLVVSVGLPFTIAVTGLIGILETHQKFKLINLIRVPLGMATYLAPLAVLPFTNSLVAVVGVLIAVRILELLIFLFCCLAFIPILRMRLLWDPAMVKPLLTFGGWLTVSNIALPLMIHIDRFIVGATRTLTDVTFYSNPAEIAVKVLTLPRAWVSALFPPLTMHLAQQSPEADALFARSVKLLLLVLFPAILGLYTLAPEFLGIWLGPSFAVHSSTILRLLSAGIFVYSLAYLAFALLQSAGRPDLSARWHLMELIPFIAVAWWATRTWGIRGMAVIWALRGLTDFAVLFPLALRFVPAARSAIWRSSLLMGLGLGVLPLVSLCPAFLPRLGVAAGGWLLFSLLAWFRLLSPGEREWARRLIPGEKKASP
jgi:O-antigen/teichoic acid export membrane protein